MKSISIFEILKIIDKARAGEKRNPLFSAYLRPTTGKIVLLA